MRVAIIDSKCANLASIAIGLTRAGGEPFITRDWKEIKAAPRVVLPGVGTAGKAMAALKESGLVHWLPTLTQPFLGICLGMQLLFENSDEGYIECLGIFPGRIWRFSKGEGIRIPHMGWNRLSLHSRGDPMIQGIEEGQHGYFVHSYYLPKVKETVATTHYGTKISAIVRKKNFWGCQFHPELSGQLGARILENFIGLPC